MKKGTDQTNKLVALRRIEGQIRGIHKMVEDQRYCVDILYAIGAAVGALKNVESLILKDHLNACVKHAFESGSSKDKDAKVQEIYNIFKGLRR